jgi:hypothetical protein
VPGCLPEGATIAPPLGPIFYRFDTDTAPESRKNCVRDASCMLCHGYFYIRDIPSLLAVTGMPD